MVSILRGPSFGAAGGPLRCSFCGRRDAAVEHLVRARGVFICDRCVAQAHEAVASAPPDQQLLRIRPTPSHIVDRDAAEAAIEQAFDTVFSAQQTGHAVRVGEEWKVSRDTWCGLVRMIGVECPPPPG
jgi:hypothetical protein